MNSNLSMDELYVFCLSCAMAQLVKSRGEGVTLMNQLEATLSGHRAFHQVGQPRVPLKLGYGSTLNKVVAMEVGDPRVVKVGKLEVREA